MTNSAQQNAYNGAQSTGVGVIYDQLGNPIVVGAQMPIGAGAGKALISDASGNLTPGTVGAASLPSATTTTQGAVIIDGTAGDFQPSPGTAAAGSVGKVADAGHVHGQPSNFAPTGLTGATAASRYVGATTSGAPASGTFVTGDWIIDQAGVEWVCTAGGTPGTWGIVNAQSLRDTYLRSSTIYGETIPRSSMLNNGLLLSGGTLYLAAVALPIGAVVGHLQFVSTTGAGTPSHWWFGLYDSNRNQLALTADQTTGAWGNATVQSLAIATTASGANATFTTTYTGLYYIGIVMTVSAGAVVTLLTGAQATTVLIAQAPILAGTSDGGQTTPPSFAHQATTITAVGNIIYGAVAT